MRDYKNILLVVDLSETGPETPSPYNAHPQAAIAHFSNYIYEYLFHSLPILQTFNTFHALRSPLAGCLVEHCPAHHGVVGQPDDRDPLG